MTLLLFQGSFFGLYIASVYKAVSDNCLSDYILTLAGSLGSICNGSSRIIWSYFQDIYGFKRVYFCILILQLFLSLTINLVKCNQILYPLYIAGTFLCEGGHFALFPAAASIIFGS